MRDNKNKKNNSQHENKRVVRGTNIPYNQSDIEKYYYDNYHYHDKRIVVKKKKKMNKKGKIVISLFVLLLSLVVAVTLLFNMQILSGDVGKLFEGIGTPRELKDKQLNFLIVGIADDPDERQKTNLTDIMAVVSVDFENKETNVLQIPRDTYIGNETPSGKINAIYNRDPKKWDYHGLEGLSRMINEMFQLNIDHYITMEMDGFREIVDAIGGVTMNVPIDMELNGTIVKAGEQTLNGKQAVVVVRTRNAYKNGDDLSRVKTQQEFMKAFVSKVLSLGKGKIAKLAPSCIKYIKTDITISDGLKYYKAISGMDSTNLHIFTPPGKGVIYRSKLLGKQSVYQINKEETEILLNENFRNHSESVPASKLQIKKIQ